MNDTDVVRARVHTDLKEGATAALEDLGLSVSEAIRRLLIYVERTKNLPAPLSLDPDIELLAGAARPRSPSLKNNRRASSRTR